MTIEREAAFLGIGSNLGDRQRSIERACDALAASPGVFELQLSTIRETEPVGTSRGPALGGPYLNGVVAVETSLEPLALLLLCLDVERRLGRVRGLPNAPREIDLDLLLHGSRSVRLEPPEAPIVLEVPHPRMLERDFVLEPLAELAPAAVHPLTGRTILEHWLELSDATS